MNIILDMGNVLLEWNKDKILQGISYFVRSKEKGTSHLCPVQYLKGIL